MRTFDVIQGGRSQEPPRMHRGRGCASLKSVPTGDTFTPSRLRWARERLMLTRTDLADAANISVSTLTAYENGRRAPLAEAKERLADALGVRPEFFYLPDMDEVPMEEVSFRKASKTSKCQQRAAMGAAQMAVEFFGVIESSFKLPDLQVPEIDDATPEQAAEEVRAQWHLADRPIADMMSLLESKGVRILSLDHRCKDVDAFCFSRDGVSYIFVSTVKTAERQRFDLAHELGHLVLHAGVPADSANSKERERQADLFASAFLMPASRIYTQSMNGAPVERILKAKKYWQVSAMAMARRLHDLKLLSDWQYRSVVIELSQRGYRSAEPDGIQREQSQLLRKVLFMMDEHTTTADTAAALHLTTDVVRTYLRDLTLT